MKQLILVRHATAESEQFPQKDFDRALSGSGLQEARQLGDFMREKGFVPDHIAFSPALRTNQTAGILKESLGIDSVPFTAVPSLYNAGFPFLMQYLQNFPDDFSSLLLVAHNPGISQLATVLSSLHPYQFSTAAGLCLQFDVSGWNKIQSGTAKEIWYFTP